MDNKIIKIVFVDPQEPKSKHWWPAIIVDPLDYEIFFDEMGEKIEIEDGHLVCYFEDASYSFVKKEEVLDISEYMKKRNLGFVLENNISSDNNHKFNENNVQNIDKYIKDDQRDIFLESNSHKSNYNLDSYYFQLNKQTIKWLNSRNMKNVLKLYKENKIPLKFKWLKKKNQRKYNKKIKIYEDPGIRKRILLERALRDFGSVD